MQHLDYKFAKSYFTLCILDFSSITIQAQTENQYGSLSGCINMTKLKVIFIWWLILIEKIQWYKNTKSTPKSNTDGRPMSN